MLTAGFEDPSAWLPEGETASCPMQQAGAGSSFPAMFLPAESGEKTAVKEKSCNQVWRGEGAGGASVQ